MRLLVINNLRAGSQGPAIYDFIRSFSSDGDEVVLRPSDTTTPFEALLHDASSFDAIVASGGDGTVTSICYALRGSGIPILPFPSGTANLLTQNIDGPTEPVALARIARECRTLDFDLGELELEGTKHGFGIMAGAGYDARIMEDAVKLKPTLRESAYLFAALSTPNPTFAHFTLDLDGKTVEEDGIVVLLVNFGRIMFDIPFTHANDPRDGLFEVAVIRSRNTMQLVPVMLSTLLDREGRFPSRTDNVAVYHAREVTVSAEPALTIQYDGEPTGINTPFTARILHGATRLSVDASPPKVERMLAEDAGEDPDEGESPDR